MMTKDAEEEMSCQTVTLLHQFARLFFIQFLFFSFFFEKIFCRSSLQLKQTLCHIFLNLLFQQPIHHHLLLLYNASSILLLLSLLPLSARRFLFLCQRWHRILWPTKSSTRSIRHSWYCSSQTMEKDSIQFIPI